MQSYVSVLPGPHPPPSGAPSPRGRYGLRTTRRCVQKPQLPTGGRGKPLPYVTTKDRGCGGGRSGAGGVGPRPYGVTGGAVCGPIWSSAPTGGLRGWWVGENDERMLTNAVFLGTLSSKLCDDKDEYGLFPRAESRRGGVRRSWGGRNIPLEQRAERLCQLGATGPSRYRRTECPFFTGIQVVPRSWPP